MSAKDGQGAGTYLLDWGTDAATGADSIELSVPGSTTKYAKNIQLPLPGFLVTHQETNQ